MLHETKIALFISSSFLPVNTIFFYLQLEWFDASDDKYLNELSSTQVSKNWRIKQPYGSFIPFKNPSVTF